MSRKGRSGHRPFRIIVAGHGSLPRGLVETAMGIVGPLHEVLAIGLEADESPEGFAERLAAVLGDDALPALVLIDLPSGTPDNVVTRLRRDRGVMAITGVNLALLLEAIGTTDELAEPLLDRLAMAGRSAIARAGGSPEPRAVARWD